MTISLRIAKKKDLNAILDIYTPYILNTAITFEYTVPKISEYEKFYSESAPQFPWVVATKEEKIIGYTYASKAFMRTAYQWGASLSIYVKQGHHGNHVGLRLYSSLLTILQKMGYYKAYAIITLPNEPSLGIHNRLGFNTSGIFKNAGYKLGKWRDIAWMEKTLIIPSSNPEPPLYFKDFDQVQLKKLLLKNLVKK